MAYVKQNIKGKSRKYIDVTATAADLTALTDLMDGEIEIYSVSSSGGTATATTPTDLNRKKFSCGNRAGELSCSFTIPHVKAGAVKSDFKAVVVGQFDANYDTTTKADYMNLLYDRN